MVNHIFVYGTLRLGQGACLSFGLEKHATYVGTYQYNGAEMFHLGGYPGIKLVSDETSVITGDLFRVQDARLIDHLDGYEGYRQDNPENSLYLRKVITVNGQEAYTYEYNHPVTRSSRVGSGNWLDRSGPQSAG